ncbi:hypothetical protein HZU73_09525 [Apis mellifera caucasica]|nr:hypothetical protein HZU73_09525 [Apis mellifera caucasica]
MILLFRYIYGRRNYIMNHITQAWNTKFSNKTKSPTHKKLLSLENIRSPIIYCGSWRSRMLDKVKECRDAIKNMMTFDKLTNTYETTHIVGKTPIIPRAATSMSSIPDVITFSGIALKHKEYEDIPILMRDSILNSDKKEKENTVVEQIDQTNNTNNSLKRFVSADNMLSNSLKSFIVLEKQIKEEFLEENDIFTTKKKISAEPFLSYVEGNAEFIWPDNTIESSSGNAWNSLEHLNSSDIRFGNPRTNSTFYEDIYVNRNHTSSPIRNHFQDSGFENNFSL